MDLGIKGKGFCRMDNHFHFVIETPRANLCAACNGWGTWESGAAQATPFVRHCIKCKSKNMHLVSSDPFADLSPIFQIA
jgi:hypothetical protein